MTDTKNRIKFFPSFLVLAIALGAGYHFLLQKSPGESQKVILSVVFMPNKIARSETIGVQTLISVNHVPAMWDHDLRQSPWVIQWELRRGQTITVSAERSPIGTMECFIHADSKQVDYQIIHGGGMVKCAYLMGTNL